MIKIKTVDDIHSHCRNVARTNCAKCEIMHKSLSCNELPHDACWAMTNGPITLSKIISYNRKAKLEKLLS